jgi:hypothetical protein
MKTMKNIFKFILAALAVVTFFSCDIPVSLGAKLDITGPVVTITSPSQRKSVRTQFTLEGTVQDDSGVDRILVTVVKGNKEFPRQWRYQNNEWQVSENYGSTWSSFGNAVLEGTSKSATWKIYIDLTIIGTIPDEGEYTFSVQAWDKGDFTDDNSYKTLVLIIDRDAPLVDVSYPLLYSDTDPTYIDLDSILDDATDREDPSYLGKFITQGFDLKWQIDDYSSIWSIDIRLYEKDVPIDNDPETILADDNYIYKYSKNLPPPPDVINPLDYQKPNGSVTVPDLSLSTPGPYGEGVLKNPITEKTSIKVVVVCYDAAGIPNDENTIGYFVYWPKANEPWITFSDGMNSALGSYGKPVGPVASNPGSIEDSVFMVFPSKFIKATAYQAHGVNRVEYAVYACNTSSGTLGLPSSTPFDGRDGPIKGTINNTPNQAGIRSTIFPWQFEVPDLTGYYVVKAKAFSNDNKPSVEYEMLFRVNDITFPDFPDSPEPIASEPLFKAISSSGQITITGTVSDATQLQTLCLAWINPESEGYAAMSQLAYFRDKDYEGWKRVLYVDYASPNPSNPRPIGYTTTETIQSASSKPNRLWKLNFTQIGLTETNRRLYRYEQTINLSDLNIGANKPLQPLKSQMFLLRAENPAKSCTIITYAPQGDTVMPEIKITNVEIKDGGALKATCIPNTYTVIEKFTENRTITINGTWNEDSMVNPNLSIDTYFKNNFKININNQLMPLSALNIARVNNTDTNGTWTLTATVRTTPAANTAQVTLGSLNDTLVIDAETRDIGGNIVEIGCSWLVESDNLKLMRISSEKDDGTYSTGQIEIFLEFSKPVKLTNSGNTLELILSSASGNTARAVYKSGQTEQNSRQYFVYTAASGHNTPNGAYSEQFLNVTGLYSNGSATSSTYNTSNYPFTWSRGGNGNPTGEGYEEIRLTTTTGKDGSTKEGVSAGSHNGYYVRTLPTTTNNTNTDYQYTLIAGKNLKIDTTPPTVSSISATTAAGWYSAGDIYITATFNEAVLIGTGSNLPRLNLKIGNGTGSTSTAASDVRVNDRTISFRYTIKENNDSSRGSPISVTGYSGSITDIAGNLLAANAVSATTLTGIYIETLKPQTPIVRVSSTPLTNPTDGSNAIRNNVDGATNYGSSTQSAALSTVYFKQLYIAIRGQNDSDYNGNQFAALEYSTNGGTNWTRAPNIINNSFEITQTGDYTLIARQIDRAGNISPNSPPITFTWDKGDIISRVSSENANGTYSQNSDPVRITVYFRKPLYFSAGPATIEISAKNKDGNNIQLSSAVTTTGNVAYNSLDFIYTIQNGDTTNGNDIELVSTNIAGLTAWDNRNTAPEKATRVNLSTPNNWLTLPTTKLDKNIKILTGSLTQTPAPAFIADNQGGTGWNSESNANFHGIRSDDGSYWTTLQIPFDREVSKGTGHIYITQSSTNYRVPAVMTEAQYNRFKNNVPNIDTYYIKGTNGFDGTNSDTSTKYVLQYTYDPSSVPTTFSDAFLAAEQIKINVNAQAVSLTTTGGKTTVNVRLSSSNAPQVPGATYTVALDAGLVSDTLGNSSAEGTSNVVLRGVAKPFIRIKKTQDTISTRTGNNSTTRITAAQPMQANARMDCRTPGSSIYYNTTDSTTNITANNLNPGTVPAAGGAPTQPAQPTNALTAYSAPITIGNNPAAIADVQGYKWRVRARAYANSTYSADSEEVAYRTVITYQVRGNMTAGDGEQILGDGDQIWIRGGDAIGSSSIPGFPFTWEDDWGNLEKKRAGIRLMTKTDTTTNLNNASIWKYVTWDLSATAYIDFIMGHDTASDANVLWQFGPINWAYQRAGWTSYKTSYPIYPGEHRWCNAGANDMNKGAINFSGTFSARPSVTANNPASGWTINSN